MAHEQWQDISTAPRDGTVIRVAQLRNGGVHFERMASWRSIELLAVHHMGIYAPASSATGWMYPDIDKRVPEPTHWKPA